MRHRITYILIVVLFSFQVQAQLITVDDNAPVKQFPQANTVFNRIFNGSGLDSFYHKLALLKKSGTGVVNIVHIGDSHTQADFFTSVVRENLQDFFGNAGRGLVFPYQLAKSNAPSDIGSSSNTGWEFNRIAHPEIAIAPGISGFAIVAKAAGASIEMMLKQGKDLTQSFNRLKFFLDDRFTSSWILSAENNDAPIIIKSDSSLAQEVKLTTPAQRFTLEAMPSADVNSFYGVSLENDSAGILYHSIGVNGARYDQYNLASLFWRQLPALQADLYIISLGTNDAQRTVFDEPAFRKHFDLFIKNLRKTNPNAALLITTAPDSYFKRRPNTVLREINLSLNRYCTSQNIPFWDLYRITGGYGSSYNWAKRNYMTKDRVHFTRDGYQIQGLLLFNALAKGYNNYVSTFLN